MKACHLPTSFALLLTAAVGGCSSDTGIAILEPERARMVEGSEAQHFRVLSLSDEVWVNETEAEETLGRVFEATIPAAEGFGFAKARAAGEEHVAVRSWHQGTFLPSDQQHLQTLSVLLGSDALSGENGSLAQLLEMMLEATELAYLVENPLTATGLTVPVDLFVTHAAIGNAEVALTATDNGIDLAATLTDVTATYETHSSCVDTSGTATIATVNVTGELTLDASGAELTNASVTVSTPEVSGDGTIPSSIINAMAAEMGDAIQATVTTTSATAAELIGGSLLEVLKPAVGVEFPQPITQQSALEQVATSSSGLQTTYGTLIRAQSPKVAEAGHGVLQTEVESAFASTSGLAARFGTPLLNQLAFAVWDAGNFEGLTYTKSDLETLGMQKLDFPYDKLREVDVRMLLPPLFRFAEDGAWLDIGGIQMDMRIDSSEDVTAWTAGHVPVALQHDEGELRLVVDESRSSRFEDIEFSVFNQLADRDEAIQITETAIPGVVRDVFGSIPAITLPGYEAVLPDGTTGPGLSLLVDGITLLSDAYQLELRMSLSAAPDETPAPPTPDGEPSACPSAFGNSLAITAPERATMVAGFNDVTVTAETDASSASLDGAPLTLDGAGVASVNVSAQDGLNTAVATTADRAAIRSWHQGTFLAPDAWHPDTMQITLGSDALSTGSASLAGLVSSVLTNAELAPYVNNPIQTHYTYDPPIGFPIAVTINTTTTSAVSPDVSVSMTVSGSDILMAATVSNLVADYESTAQSLFTSTGTVSYEEMVIEGTLAINYDGATLPDATVTSATDPVIVDSGAMPAEAVSFVLASMDTEIKQAMADAAANATVDVADRLLDQLQPAVGVSFDEPITQGANLTETTVAGGQLGLTYETQIQAQTPTVAGPDHGILSRTTTSTAGASTQVTTLIGSPLLNQLIFAAWDAGNFAAVGFTAQELEEAGMPVLEFPYNLLEQAQVNLLLPPLVEWVAGEGAWLEVGGIEVTAQVSGIEDTRMWTAARIPIVLEPIDGSTTELSILIDTTRAIDQKEVEIEQLNPFAAVDDVYALVEAAVPAAVELALGAVPAVTLPSVSIDRLDGSAGPHVSTHLLNTTQLDDAWLLEIEMR